MAIAMLCFNYTVGVPLHAPVQSQLLNTPEQRTCAHQTRQTAPRMFPRLAHSKHVATTQLQNIGMGPQCPALRANPCSKVADPFCRRPLPTLLNNQRLLTLGTCCGCWHEKHKHETIHLSLFENHRLTTHLRQQGFIFIHTPFPQAI